MNKREFVMLAKNLSEREIVNGMYMSIKLDGQRALWDGGVTRGMPKFDVPWANTKKDERYLERQYATGLWTRYGNVIHAPDWFLNALPRNILLDGELYLDRGKFQETRTIVSTIIPGDDWRKITFNVFDLPSFSMFADSGTINNPNFTKHILRDDCFKLFKDMSKQVLQFNTTIMQLYGLYNQNRGQTVWKPLEQIQLPSNESTAKTKLMELLEKETALGGEGIMLRSPNSIWHPKRTGQLLKVKKLEDSEARVIGWVAGLGKLSGLFGALIVDWNGKTFELSGFTDDERAVNDNGWARLHPGEVGPDQYWPVKFRKGCTIRFMYRGLTDSGLPREARYLR